MQCTHLHRVQQFKSMHVWNWNISEYLVFIFPHTGDLNPMGKVLQPRHEKKWALTLHAWVSLMFYFQRTQWEFLIPEHGTGIRCTLKGRMSQMHFVGFSFYPDVELFITFWFLLGVDLYFWDSTSQLAGPGAQTQMITGKMRISMWTF